MGQNNYQGRLQKPIGSGFNASSTAADVIKGIDLKGKIRKENCRSSGPVSTSICRSFKSKNGSFIPEQGNIHPNTIESIANTKC